MTKDNKQMSNETLKTQLTGVLAQLRAGLAQEGLVDADPAPSADNTTAPSVQPTMGPTFNQQVVDIRERHMKETTNNPAESMARAQIGKALAAAKQPERVEIARRVARELAANGPVAIDDVTQRIRDMQMESTADIDPKNRRFWKGAVFTTSEWVYVGRMPSRIPSNHARPVNVWCLKTWLAEHSLNGTAIVPGSHFNVLAIFKDFQRKHPGVRMQDCNWRIGTGDLSDQTRSEIKAGQMMLYGAPVTLVEGAVGAMLELPGKMPQPAATTQEIPST